MTEIKAEEMLDIVDVRTYLGIEFGSTRIKAVLIDSRFHTIASGSYEWENQLVNGFWTYSTEEIWKGLRRSYRELATEVYEKYGVVLEKVGAIGFSAMMHGYMAFDDSEKLLVPFRTWRNSTTSQAAQKLTKLFDYNIPERWSIAHFYQAILNHEEHVPHIDYLTTLAGYVHWQLTGEKVLGIGDASGMFPIDNTTKNYDEKLIKIFEEKLEENDLSFQLKNLLPKVLLAGDGAGVLTEQGAFLIDPTGNLKAGIPFCPPEGDAGTGMVATNSIEVRTGNVSVGTSAFAMIVLEKKLSKVYPEIDIVTTPEGNLVGMVHANNCSSDINAWIKLFEEYTESLGIEVSREKIFSILFNKALEADKDLGGLLSYGYFSGENITGVSEGRPLFVRQPDSNFNLANFMRTNISSAFGAIRVGMDILHQEKIEIDGLVGHGGIFKTPQVGQRILASAVQKPVTVMETAGEGGAWGMAVLAAFRTNKAQELTVFLKEEVFVNSESVTVYPSLEDEESYNLFIKRYVSGLDIERKAAEKMK
ncbi:xylulokinase [Lactococcus kimchii]|uniref:xylulokinase n=1 Tax=Lactococcus sp. S-13 TaxID=2507158 RepID=UPI001023DCB0|nr:FGGY-family carbohydrate kinase [Lactococcus sp. S-13]RZI48029.1 ATPase [Lactococcus sp. S-13]